MRPDIVNIRQFYSSRLGQRVAAALRRAVRDHWPDTQNAITLGIGYTTPLLRDPSVALMPAAQGALYWPVHGHNRSILADEMRPPFAVNSLPRILLMHTLEHAARPDELLRILWQLLEPGGRLLLVIPSRRGLWARFGNTPFATGTPYRLHAIKQLLHEAEFTLCETSAALFPPPSTHPFWLRSWPMIEWLGRLFLPRSGGVFIVEAEKQIYAGVGTRATLPAWQVARASAPA